MNQNSEFISFIFLTLLSIKCIYSIFGLYFSKTISFTSQSHYFYLLILLYILQKLTLSINFVCLAIKRKKIPKNKLAKGLRMWRKME